MPPLAVPALVPQTVPLQMRRRRGSKSCSWRRNDCEMLLKEIRYLQRLRHPRLVSFLGAVDRPPHLLLIMEFMPGGSLHSAIFGSGGNRSKQLNLGGFLERARMISQVSEGLTYLHDLGVVHRDLKTMNIVLDAALNCKICDFGLTVTLERTHLTVRSMQGSPRYMAPEQFESTARITEKVDIWQMGCVMLELFCASVPFSHCSGVRQIATDLLVRRRGPTVPADADPHGGALIRACLRIQQKARPPAAVLEEALALVRQG
eukprot:TRINITY_DN11518_c0_g2_i2.p1 TRINITY_DN11518_c0_g2~~TRINITY_DN11518_c0_g2_i2.p1  ORF type:complete len:261 (-),score=51.33 TRINITY_DN11518_c0_g2_i2:46-828(-)